MADYGRAKVFAMRIELELRRMGCWQETPLPASAFQSREAFHSDTMTLFQWLQFVLLERVRTIVAERGKFPAKSQVGLALMRELDSSFGGSSVEDPTQLIQVVCEFDSFIEDGAGAEPEPEDTAEPKPPAVVVEAVVEEDPRDVVERYWTSRDAALVHSAPGNRASFDVSIAEGVFESVTSLERVLEDPPEERSEGRAYRCLVNARRGQWVIVTVVRRDERSKYAYRVNLNGSVAATAQLYLAVRGFRPPFTEADDARGCAMKYWTALHARNLARARELLLDEQGVEPSPIGLGTMDEFIWYLDQTGEEFVRVLVNFESGCRVWTTVMKRNENGDWRVARVEALCDGLFYWWL